GQLLSKQSRQKGRRKQPFSRSSIALLFRPNCAAISVSDHQAPTWSFWGSRRSKDVAKDQRELSHFLGICSCSFSTRLCTSLNRGGQDCDSSLRRVARALSHCFS